MWPENHHKNHSSHLDLLEAKFGGKSEACHRGSLGQKKMFLVAIMVKTLKYMVLLLTYLLPNDFLIFDSNCLKI